MTAAPLVEWRCWSENYLASHQTPTKLMADQANKVSRATLAINECIRQPEAANSLDWRENVISSTRPCDAQPRNQKRNLILAVNHLVVCKRSTSLRKRYLRATLCEKGLLKRQSRLLLTLRQWPGAWHTNAYQVETCPLNHQSLQLVYVFYRVFMHLKK